MGRRLLVAIATLLLALAAPTAAHAAPTVQPLKPCYITAGPLESERERVQVVAEGFNPNSNVDVTVDGTALPAAKAGMDGALSFEVPAPYVKRTREFAITLTEQGNPANTTTATAMTTALGVDVKPRTAKPSDRIRFKGLGFTEDAPVYAHYIYKGRVRKTVPMAWYPGECGSWEARKRQIPVRNPGVGKWTIQFDQSKRFPATTPIVYVRLAIKVRLVRKSRCDPNYAGACLKPNVSDYDCAGGSGDGPYYTGRVRVVGKDHYDLDRDGDGVACET